MRSTLQTVSAPSHLICPLTGQLLVNPVEIWTEGNGTPGTRGLISHYFESAVIELILNTTGILPILNVPITRANIRTGFYGRDALMKELHQYHAIEQAQQAQQAALQAILAATPQLVPVYQPVEVLRRSLNTVSSASQVTATVKNPPKNEEGFFSAAKATFVGLFSSDKSAQAATATTQAPSQQATATTSPLATTTQPAVADRILLSVSQKGYLKVSFPTDAMCETIFSGLDDANLISRRGRVLYIPAMKKETNEGELPTLCATFSSSTVFKRLVERVQLKENDRIKFGTGEKSSHLFLSHEGFFIDPNASLKIRIPTWLQPEASSAPQPSGPRR